MTLPSGYLFVSSEPEQAQRERVVAAYIPQTTGVAMKAHVGTLKRYAEIAAVVIAAALFAALSFVVVGLAEEAFGAVVSIPVNLGIIGLFCYVAWILRFEMYRNLRILH